MLKIFVPVFFIAAQFLITWYGYFTGKLPESGKFFGISYNSVFAKALIVQFEFFWLLILINFLFSLGFHFGFESYKNFLVIAVLWIASGPLAAVMFNVLFVREKMDVFVLIGVFLVTVGAIVTVAHKEIAGLF